MSSILGSILNCIDLFFLNAHIIKLIINLIKVPFSPDSSIAEGIPLENAHEASSGLVPKRQFSD